MKKSGFHIRMNKSVWTRADRVKKKFSKHLGIEISMNEFLTMMIEAELIRTGRALSGWPGFLRGIEKTDRREYPACLLRGASSRKSTKTSAAR